MVSQKGFAAPEKGLLEQQDDIVGSLFPILNPVASLRMLWDKHTAITTLICGIHYANFSCLQASIPTLFVDLCGLLELNAGINHSPFGPGSCIEAY